MANLPTASSYPERPIADQWDVIVIGSGIGGLATAALLARHGGKRVLVLERNSVAGGFTHSFSSEGYEWNLGVHYVGQMQDPASLIGAAFEHLTAGQLRWSSLPQVYDRARIGDREYDFVAGRDAFRDRMKSYFPKEAAAIDTYLHAIESCFKRSTPYFKAKVLPRSVGWMAGPLMRGPFLRWAERTTAQVLSGITTHRELTAVLTAQWGDYGLAPSESSFGVHAMLISHYIDGASFPVGGPSRLAACVAPAIEAAGGEIVVNAEVSQILLGRSQRAEGVRMQDGRELRAGLVVSAAGAKNTFEVLLPRDAPGAARAITELRRVPPSIAHVCLCAGAKQSSADLGLSGTNLWIHPTPDYDLNLARFRSDPAAPFPVLFISSPSSNDPDFVQRHPGRSTLEVVSLVPYDLFARWENPDRRGRDYEDLKESLMERLRGSLDEHIPAVRGKLDVVELLTPLSTRRHMNCRYGESYGLSATPARFRLRCLSPRTSVRNLFLTGQDACMIGVAGAAMGGVLTASAVLGRNLVPVVLKPNTRS